MAAAVVSGRGLLCFSSSSLLVRWECPLMVELSPANLLLGLKLPLSKHSVDSQKLVTAQHGP